MITDRPAVLDTCVLINILATNRIAEIVQVIAPTCFVCAAVSAESLYLRPLEVGAKPEVVEISPLLKAGVLVTCAIEAPAEEEAYVNYALELDDGEAMSLAIAQGRKFALATDDRKARRIIRAYAPNLPIISTSEIMRAWAEGKSQVEIAKALHHIHVKAKFHPADEDPLADRWNSF